MRLKAHPIPTKQLYTTMIRTCGDPRDPQPERARDLWIEMTQEGNKVSPTREEYDAIIRALGSTKKDYLEAFELLRQMLAKHHDATFVPFEDTPKSICSPSSQRARLLQHCWKGRKGLVIWKELDGCCRK